MSAQPYSLQSVRAGASAFIQGRVLAGALNFAVALILVRFMAIEQYAVYVTMGGLIVILSEAAGLGLPHVISRYVPEGRLLAHPADLRRFIRWVLLAAVTGAAVIAGLLALLAAPIGSLLNADHAPEAVIANCAFALAYAVSQRLIHINEALLAQDAVRLGIIIEWLPKLAILVGWIAWRHDITAAEALIVQAATAGLGALVLAWQLARRLRTLTASAQAAGPWPADPRAIRAFSLKSWAHTLVLLPTETWGMRTLAAAYLASSQMAAFGFFHALAGSLRRYFPIHFLLVTLETLLIARFTESRDFARLNETANLLFKLNLAVLAPLMAWLGVVGFEVTTMLTGGKYASLAWIFPVVLAEPVLESQWYLLRTAANAVERPGILLQAAAISLIPLAVILVLLAGHVGDPLPEILASMIALPLIRNAVVMVQLRRAGFRYRLDLGTWLRVPACAALAGGVSLGLAHAVSASPSAARAIVATVVFAVVYLLAILLLRPFARSELDFMRTCGGPRLRLPSLLGIGR